VHGADLAPLTIQMAVRAGGCGPAQRRRAELLPALLSTKLDFDHGDTTSSGTCTPTLTTPLPRPGSAAMLAPVLDAFEERFGVVILEGYGLTETALTTTFNKSVTGRRVYSVGKPIWGTQTEVWDENCTALPPGQDHVAEILTRGLHVMKGYLNNPVATAEAFTDGWLHTGDLGYFDEDGYLFIVSRKKEPIIRGGVQRAPERDRGCAAFPSGGR
jgi:acyl-CoA synthetase (AMP-forming)/AMP-acid ligase II